MVTRFHASLVEELMDIVELGKFNLVLRVVPQGDHACYFAVHCTDVAGLEKPARHAIAVCRLFVGYKRSAPTNLLLTQVN